MNIKRAKFLSLILAITLIVAGGLSDKSFAADKSDKAGKPPAKVIVSTVKKSPITDMIEALGTLKANESVDITATVTEKITAIHFDDGQRVEAGQTLIEMTNDEEHAQLNEARATLKEARKQFNRFKELTASKAVSKSVLDLRRREMETAKARLNAIESRMSDRLIKAPFAGVVGLRNISVGALIQPGDIITNLHDDSVMKLDFSVPSTYIVALKAGLEVTAKARAYPNQEFSGVVKSVESSANPITRSVQVRAIITNDDRLLIPGILMSVVLNKNPREAIVIAEEAVVLSGDEHFIYRIDENQAVKKQNVTIGTRQRGMVEVLQGLNVGDKIITRGMTNLRDGQKVEILAEETEDNASLSELLAQEKTEK